MSLKQVQHVWRHCVAKWFETSYYHKQAGLSGHVPKQAFSREGCPLSCHPPAWGMVGSIRWEGEGVNEQQWQIGFLIGVVVREGLG